MTASAAEIPPKIDLAIAGFGTTNDSISFEITALMRARVPLRCWPYRMAHRLARFHSQDSLNFAPDHLADLFELRQLTGT